MIALMLAGAFAAPPNFVFLIGEDMGPELGCYGDPNAITPNIDRLAREGVRFTRCYTHAPVCAPSRSGLVTGRFPTGIGTHHMRSTLLAPPPIFTDHLRAAGYAIAWPTRTPFGKTDFNFNVPIERYDIVTDWTKAIPKGPFFGYFNVTTSHESQIRAPADRLAKNIARLKAHERRDPAKMRVPAYHPDDPAVRRDLANYYDLVTAVDYQIGDVLAKLDAAGVAENTVVIFFGDHGRGLPRSKRWVYEQGIHVPLIVRWPAKLKAGSVRDDLVCFLDLAPTLLDLAGVPIPRELQGRPLFPSTPLPRREFVFSCRDRMDERYDRIRSVRGERFHYIRNHHPELPYSQRIAYAEEMPTLQVWRRLHAEGKLNAVQEAFFAPSKPAEELYDVPADPDEVKNLAGETAHAATLATMRQALVDWEKETGDLGAIPETELIRKGLVKDRLAEYEIRKR